MFQKAALRAVLTLSLLQVAACADEDPGEGLFDSIQRSPVVASGPRFAMLSHNFDELWVLTPSARGAEQAVIPLDDEPISITPTSDGKILVLTAREAKLVVIESEDLTVREIPLASGYDSLAISDDGRFVIAHFGSTSTGTADTVLFNPNEVTVIDLDAEDAEPLVFTLRGPRPIRFDFAPEFTLTDPETPLHFAVAIAASAVSFVDLTTESEVDRQRLVPLAEPSSGRTLVPQRVLFSSDDRSDPNDMTAFVLASGSPEIFAVDLLPADPASGRMLQPAINQVAGGVSPAQMHPFQIGGRDKLLVVDGGSNEVIVIDVPTSSATHIELERTVRGALLWDQVEAGDVRPRALFYSPGTNLVYFAELEVIERQGMGALRPMSLGRAVESIERAEVTGAAKAVARYSSGQGLEIINLETRAVVPIPASVTLGPFALDGDRLFTVTPYLEKLVAVDLLTSAPAEIEIPAAGTSVTVAGDHVLVTHDEPGGWVSLYEAANFSDGPTTEIYGFFLEGLFERDFDTND